MGGAASRLISPSHSHGYVRELQRQVALSAGTLRRTRSRGATPSAPAIAHDMARAQRCRPRTKSRDLPIKFTSTRSTSARGPPTCIGEHVYDNFTEV